MASPAISPNNGQPTPPPGYKMDATPPPGYVLDPDYSQVPAFLQQGIDMSKVKQVVTAPSPGEGNAIAAVDSTNPYQVKVLDPGLYGPPILNHELTHTFQDTRSPGIAASVPLAQSGRQGYDYGGLKGLQVARQAGRTVSDLNYEQQAEMVKDYKVLHDRYLTKAAQGKITPADEKQMYDLQQAYHPFIKQLADMPNTEQDPQRHPLLELLGLQKPPTIDTRPTPPGLPAYNTPGLGILPADPLMGGKSQSTVKSTPMHPVLKSVLEEYPGLSKNFNGDNVTVVFASGDRAKRGLKERGGLEFWDKGDKGDEDYPSPDPTKNVLEIYSDKLKQNPKLLKQAIYGDLMHGMTNDSYWKSLRTEFMSNFTPQELKRQEQKKAWADDVNNTPPNERFGPTYDAYIRGWLTNQDFKYGEYVDIGNKELGNTQYSPKQIQLLQKMRYYLKTGNAPPGTGKPGDPVNPYSKAPFVSPEQEPPSQSYARNKQWAKSPGPNGYVTPLPPDQEKRFQQWAHDPQNWMYVQHDMGPAPGYDIRGWFKAMEAGDPRAGRDPVSHHFGDTWKTPYSGVFSRESQYALPTAPHWHVDDKTGWTLVAADGRWITMPWKPEDDKKKPSDKK